MQDKNLPILQSQYQGYWCPGEWRHTEPGHQQPWYWQYWIKIIPSPNVNFNWPISQILECTCSISQNAPFRTEMCTFLFWMTHSGIWNRCILGFVRLVYCMPSSMTRHTGHTWVTGSPLEQPSSEWDMPSDSHCWGYRIILCHVVKSLQPFLTHWGRMTHICVSKVIIIGSDNGLLPGWCQAVIWTNAGILLFQNFSEILSEIHTFSFKKMPW